MRDNIYDVYDASRCTGSCLLFQALGVISGICRLVMLGNEYVRTLVTFRLMKRNSPDFTSQTDTIFSTTRGFTKASPKPRLVPVRVGEKLRSRPAEFFRSGSARIFRSHS